MISDSVDGLLSDRVRVVLRRSRGGCLARQHPKARAEALRVGRHLFPPPEEEHMMRLMELWHMSYGYYAHQSLTRAAIDRGDGSVLLIATAEYWRLQLSPDVHAHAPFVWNDLELVLKPSSTGECSQLSTTPDDHGHHYLVAPISEAPPDASPGAAGAVHAVCARCHHQRPYYTPGACITCTQCLAVCWCSHECMHADAAHHAPSCTMAAPRSGRAQRRSCSQPSSEGGGRSFRAFCPAHPT